MEIPIGVILGLFVLYMLDQRQTTIIKKEYEAIDERVDKYTTLFSGFPDDAKFIFVSSTTYDWLRCSKAFADIDKVPADLRVIRPGVEGYMYGYGIIVDEELAGTYL